MASRRTRFALAGAGLVSLACSSLVGLVATPTPSATAVPTATATATATPTPTPVPVTRIESADLALFQADWETALQQFQSVLADTDSVEDHGAAQLGIAAAYLRSGRFEDALAALDQFLAAYAGHAQEAEAHFLRGIAEEELERHAQALAEYDRYFELRPGVIDPYVHERAGDSLRRLGRPLESVPRYRAAIAAGPTHGTLTLEVKTGVAYLEAHDYESAIAQFEAVASGSNDPEILATMNYLVGQALEGLGRSQEAYARYTDSVLRFPEASDTYTGLLILVQAGVPVDDFLRGLVDFQAGAYEPAIAVFDRLIANEPSAAAYYYRGLSRRALDNSNGALSDFTLGVELFPDDPLRPTIWREKAVTEWAYVGNYEVAVDSFVALVAAYPVDPTAPQSLFDAGRTSERIGNLATAATLWSRLAAEYPQSPYGYRGAFEGGVVRYRLGDFAGARQSFQTGVTLASEPSQQAASLLWQGKSYNAQGETALADEAYRQAAEADPTGHYSVRAEEILAGQPPMRPSGVFDFDTDPAAERAEAEAWLRTHFVVDGPEPLSSLDPELAADPRVVRGRELWRLGLLSEGRDELEALREAVSTDAEATYRLMHTLLELRLYRSAIFAARQILTLAGMDDGQALTAPVYFNRIRFGPYFGELILPAAVRYQLDGLFVLSVVRQESLFEGFAISYADARGLMQVIPSTGASIAEQIAWPPGYTESDLYRPLVSVEFGTFYLAQQANRFDGDLYAALAAYNAGPGNSLIWKELAPADPDLFLEVIRLQQPYDYIRTISEVYAIYQRLYAR